MSFWNRFQSLCDQKGVKPSNVAKELGFSSSLCTQWKQGQQNPSYDKASKIAKYFNVPVTDLLDDTIEPNKPIFGMRSGLPPMPFNIPENGAVYIPDYSAAVKQQNAAEKQQGPANILNVSQPQPIDFFTRLFKTMTTAELIQVLGQLQAVLVEKQRNQAE